MGRAKKDPNAPKKSLTDYMLFQQEKRAQVKEDHPDATFGEIGKHLGDMWKRLDEDDKKVCACPAFQSNFFESSFSCAICIY
jgi:hypothetical protein